MRDTRAVTVLDNRRTPCAVGLIRANAVIEELPRGDVLEIYTRDRFASVEIPLWARRAGHSEPTRRVAGTWPFRFQVFSVISGGKRPSN